MEKLILIKKLTLRLVQAELLHALINGSFIFTEFISDVFVCVYSVKGKRADHTETNPKKWFYSLIYTFTSFKN